MVKIVLRGIGLRPHLCVDDAVALGGPDNLMLKPNYFRVFSGGSSALRSSGGILLFEGVGESAIYVANKLL